MANLAFCKPLAPAWQILKIYVFVVCKINVFSKPYKTFVAFLNRFVAFRNK